MNQEIITIVSGLPRSGTSMMMKMLAAGGIEPVTDNLRQADEDNPKGYLEVEKIKELAKDNSWVGEAKGKVIKAISALLKHLPSEHHYKIIFMRRKMGEILASQKQMLIRRGEPTDKVSDEVMANLFEKHLKEIEAWLAAQPNMDVIYISYNETLTDAQPSLAKINEFLGGDLNTQAMIEVVDHSLHRQRR